MTIHAVHPRLSHHFTSLHFTSLHFTLLHFKDCQRICYIRRC